MSRMNELSQVLDDLIACGEHLIAISTAIKQCFTADEAPKEEPEKKTKKVKKEAKAPETEEKNYTREEVRDLLAKATTVAEGSFKAEVKSLVRKYANGGVFTDVPAEKYCDLVKEVEDLING